MKVVQSKPEYFWNALDKSKDPINFLAGKSVLEGLDAYSVEWRQRVYPWHEQALALVIGGNLFTGNRLQTLHHTDGRVEIWFGAFASPAVQMYIAPPTRALIKIKSTAGGHTVYVNGSAVTPEYAVGDDTVPLTMSATLETFQLESTFSGLFFGFRVYDAADAVVADWPLTDGAGLVGHENVSGYNAVLTNIEWVEEHEEQGNLLSPLGRITDRIDFVANPPSDALLCLYVDSNGTPINTTNWTAYAAADIHRNPDLWMPARYLTCVSVWSDADTAKRYCVTMLSPRHFITADHVTSLAVGSTLVFADENDNKQTTTILDRVKIGSGDTAIGILADDLTLDIQYAEIIPPAFVAAHGYGDTATSLAFDACGVSRDGWLDLGEFVEIGHFGMLYDALGNRWFPYSRYSLDAANRTGDSGRPQFLYNGDKLVFAFAATTFSQDQGLLVSGNTPADYLDDIQSAMDDFDSTYSRTPSYTVLQADI